MSEIPLDELRTRREHLSTRLDEVIAEIIDVVATDVPAFVKRAARAAFVNQSIERSESLSDDAIRDIKRKLVERAEAIASEVRGELESDTSAWRGDDVPEAEGKTLEPNDSVWQVVQTIASRTATALTDVGLEPGDEAEPLTYHTPTWFIDGKYPPGLIEKYWTQLALLREADRELKRLDDARRREALAARWDEL